MTATTTQEIPAALPVSEAEDEREKLLKQAADENSASSERLSVEPDDEQEEFDEAAAELAKPSKKKLFLAFVGFVFGFVMLLAVLCWFFGIGVFAESKKQIVDRTAKTSQSQPAPATEDEKLKMALNIVAEKTSNGGDNNLTTTDTNGAATSDSSLTVPPAKTVDLNEPVVVADSLSSSNPNVGSKQSVSTNEDFARMQNNVFADKNRNVPSDGKSNSFSDAPSKSESQALGRSLFFGAQKPEKAVSSGLLSQNVNQTILKSETVDSKTGAPIPFGTLLPVRFLGAVFTLRASGGLVRMELTRAVSGKNYSYPAGTVLVGTLRGSEYKRAFISVVGLIDPSSGGLVKFEGEVMGGDGASGVVGQKRKIKSAWSRVLAGLREVGASAVNVIGSRRSGGTVVISDSSTRASGVLSQELGGVARNDSSEFVEISAGTSAYVLVTDLPDEISEGSRLAQSSKSATGLSDEELATLFSEGSPEKLRAALPRMTPQFRRLAEQALAAMNGE
jgi:Na+-transporting methylmalonyl-CoA/oxaloacetate decarboxylase gamma subunit